MKQILAVIKPYLVEKVIAAMAELPIDEISIREVKGFGRQKNYLDRYRDNEYSGAFIPKVELSIWCNDEDAESVVETMMEVSRTGRMGDGKIMIMPVLGQQIIPEK
jgi:nitrogen regulatory protein PII